MNKYLFLILSLFLFACQKEVSEKQADYFLKFYGSYLNDRAAAVQELEDGGYAILGTAETKERGDDIALIITDKYGRKIGETHFFGMTGDDVGKCLLKLDDGLLIGGSVESTISGKGDDDAVLLKTDFSGNPVGEMVFYDKNGNDDIVNCIIEKENGGFMFVGSSANSFIIVNYDRNLNRINDKTNDDGIPAELQQFVPYSENLFLGLGTKYSNSDPDYSLTFLVGIDNNAGYEENGEFGDDSKKNDFASAVLQDKKNLFIASTLKVRGIPNSSISIRKIQLEIDPLYPSTISQAEEVDVIEISAPGSLEANGLTIKEDGSMLLLATHTFAGDKNIYLYQLDENGKQTGEIKEFGSTGEQTAVALLYSKDRIVIAANNEYDGNSMIALIKTDSQGNLWEE